MTPAQIVVKAFGSIRKTAAAIGRDRTSVQGWFRNGRSGLIPSKLQPKILDIAEAKGLDISAEDLIRGRKCQN